VFLGAVPASDSVRFAIYSDDALWTADLQGISRFGMRYK
jgi:hypothetical protein